MQKAIDLVKKIRKNISGNFLEDLDEINLHTIFSPIYRLDYSQQQANTIICLIILSYDKDSQWIDLKRDRYQDKLMVLEGIGVDSFSSEFKSVYKPILEYKNDLIDEISLKYLFIQADARWQEINSLLDYSTKMILFCNRTTKDNRITGTKIDEDKQHVNIYEDYDQSELTKLNKEKGDLMMKAIDARAKAESFLEQIKREFVKLDHITQSELGFEFTDTSNYDIMSWRDHIKKKNTKKGQAFSGAN